MNKYRVAVLRGGPSEEYDVSIATGAGVLSAIDTDRYQPLDVVITKSGEWLLGGRVRTPQDIACSVDVVFLALHGAYGEDGTVQRLLDTLGVPYTGSGAFPSAIALNKAMTKDRLRDSGINMARHMLVNSDACSNIDGMAQSINELFGPRYVVKPVSSGSSIGTIIADNPHMLAAALRKSLGQYEQVLVEEFIAGKEATCGVLNNFRNQSIYALPVVEIIPPQKAGFFNYEVKYNGETQEICPGRFSHAEKEEIERLAKMVHETLELSQYSRSDFIIRDDGVYFLEINTLPGLTPESLIPKALGAVGCSYQEFVHHLIDDALLSRRR